MAMNPRVVPGDPTKMYGNPPRPQDPNDLWLYWDPDPKAVGYDLVFCYTAKHVQVGKGGPTRGVRLGRPPLPFQIGVCPAYPQPWEIATYPLGSIPAGESMVSLDDTDALLGLPPAGGE